MPQSQQAAPSPAHPFAGYSREERPLAAYATLAGAYNALFAGFVVAARNARRPIPQRIGLADILLVGVATHKLSRLLTRDWVTSFLRAPFTRFQGPGTLPAEVQEKPRGEGLQRALGELVT